MDAGIRNLQAAYSQNHHSSLSRPMSALTLSMKNKAELRTPPSPSPVYAWTFTPGFVTNGSIKVFKVRVTKLLDPVTPTSGLCPRCLSCGCVRQTKEQKTPVPTSQKRKDGRKRYDDGSAFSNASQCSVTKLKTHRKSVSLRTTNLNLTDNPRILKRT